MTDIAKDEFDPTKELHHPLLYIKLVDPGCTYELQIESFDGKVIRLTTTDDDTEDLELFCRTVLAAFRSAYDRFNEKEPKA